MIAPAAPLFSPRGKVLENGMPRFFRRLAEGVFDEDDVRHRAQRTGRFRRRGAQALRHRRADRARLFERRQYRRGACCCCGRACSPARYCCGRRCRCRSRPADLTGEPVLIDSGAHDPMMSPQGAARLATVLQQDGAIVEHRTLPSGHELSQADVSLASSG